MIPYDRTQIKKEIYNENNNKMLTFEKIEYIIKLFLFSILFVVFILLMFGK